MTSSAITSPLHENDSPAELRSGRTSQTPRKLFQHAPLSARRGHPMDATRSGKIHARAQRFQRHPARINEGNSGLGLRRRKAHRPSNPSADRREFVGDSKD